MNALSVLAVCCATIPALLWLWNVLIYREPKPENPFARPISVLIPARNEERVLEASLSSVLASRGVEMEVLVLDDGSTDRTEEIVSAFAARDARVRLQPGVPLPAGWNGKQHACHILASEARAEILCFLDADVRLEPEALAAMVNFLEKTGSSLVSGFPQQETKTPLESLLLPLIHFVLLSYLPLAAMRALPAPGFGAGCGQFLMVRREAYQKAGGHAAIRTTMHDGLLLPQLFRKDGFKTDIADLTHLATCRMYRNAAEVWRGLSKNATEGMAATGRIVPFTLLLFCGQVLPLLLVLREGLHPWLAVALAASYLPRLVSVWKYRQSPISAVLHPVGVTVLLALQWSAWVRKLAGQPVTWKERAYRVG